MEQAFRNGAAFSPNTRGRAGWQMRGHTDGGRRLVAVVVWTDERDRVLRAVTARDER